MPKSGVGSVTEVLVIVGVSGWSSKTSPDLGICGGVYGPRRILSVSEGPKDLEDICSAFATGEVASEVTSIGASSGITCIGAAPSTASDTALARRLACSEPGAIAEFEPSSVSPNSAVDDGFVEVCSVVLLVLELIVSSACPGR